MTTQRIFTPLVVDGVPEISPQELTPQMPGVVLIDVRRPDEFNGELSHIPGARLVTLGPELDSFLESHDKNDEIVFVCRSGARSAQATIHGQASGFSKCVNLKGGMLLWNELKRPVNRR